MVKVDMWNRLGIVVNKDMVAFVEVPGGFWSQCGCWRRESLFPLQEVRGFPACSLVAMLTYPHRRDGINRG
jgi:hypothetical protein